ncbi:TetR/AcrR family transcriptional regulator [Streptomyces phaeolivaceus]|uniref:TetR/AcrR family transcriptional regulator n=1 Tax=Streptomyces phaeolivaceus TaxID=2653200 RepID=A0A5P8JWZ8_9ACTN|nr:TetR/AcrR family transcriptional regulator [Streptomyces phaeolivaceus]QFQ95371.1 TetR/AcrR family transcriptional regulator [Streptomyces phaeolivaceus]
MSTGEVPQRSDAQRNRQRILEVALAELPRAADVPLSTIAKKAGVGQATFYRNFPDRDALVLEVHRQEIQQLVDSADALLRTQAPDDALRARMDGLARYATAKAGLADALRQASAATGGAAKPGHPLLLAAIERLIDANHEAGTIRLGVTADDFVLAIAGIWQIAPQGDWQPRAARLIDLVTRGLRAGAPGRE